MVTANDCHKMITKPYRHKHKRQRIPGHHELPNNMTLGPGALEWLKVSPPLMTSVLESKIYQLIV